MEPAEAHPRPDSVYRLSPAHTLRLVGPFALLFGAAWVVTALFAASRGWMVVLGAITVAAAVGGAYLLLRPPRVLTLTDAGYRVTFVRGAGRGGAPWQSVESVGTVQVRGGPALVFTLSDGGRSALPLALLGARNGEAQREVHERLNRAFGYRRL